MKLNPQRHCLVILLLCVGLTGVASLSPNPVLGCESATGLVHINDVATHKRYKTAWAEIGARIYTDRGYKIRQITPGLAGGVLVRTANNDKWFNKERLFTLTVDQDAFVYICFDQRAMNQLPKWLEQDQWSLMSHESIVTSDWSASPMVVFGKAVGGGVTIPMRGNQYGSRNGAKSNYFAVVKFDKPGSRLLEILSVSSNRSYRLGEAKRHARYLVDRKYRIRDISPELDGGVLVHTANDDKRNNAETHLRLYMYKPTTLFVAYDKRGADMPPQWLADWERTDLTIRTGDFRASPMVVYRRSFERDEIAELGGNRFNGGQKAYSNYFVVGVADEPWKRKALMVVGGSRLNFSDAMVKSRLEARGFRVTLVDDDAVEATDGDGKDIILVSETVYSKRVGDIFAQKPVPIICWEPYLFDDLGMTGPAAGIDYGYVREQQALDIIQPEHPMAARIEKETPVTKYPTRFGWAVPDESATVVATLVGDPGKAAVFYYDVDTRLPGGFPAPARRIGLFFDKRTAKKLNANGRQLLEAAFDTALGVRSFKILSDSSWKSTDQEYEGWAMPEFDASDWRDAVAPYPNRKPAHHWFRIPGTNAQYMWDFPYGGEMTGRNGPEDVWLRKDFNLPVAPSSLTSATVTMAVDDVYEFYVNGQLVTSSWDSPGNNGLATLDISEHLVKGNNVLAIYASDAYRGYEWALFEATIEWETVEIPEREWTVMVYLNGDNNNEAETLDDLHEMEYGLSLAMASDPHVVHKLALVVQYDGAGMDDSVRYLVQPDTTLNSDITSEKLASLGEVNMGDPATLRDFIAFCKEEYPANHYALILSNHGPDAASPPVYHPGQLKNYTSSPVKYILWDETNGADRLYVGEMTHAPGRLTETESVDVIGLDTGFMGTVETAYQYRKEAGKFSADFMVASPALAVPEGWNYPTILDLLGDVSGLMPRQLAETLVAAYAKTYTGTGSNDRALGAYDLSAITAVKQTLDRLAKTISEEDLADGLRDLKQEVEAARGFASAADSGQIIEYFDNHPIESNSTDPTILTAASNWLQTPLFDLYAFSRAMPTGSVELNSAILDVTEAVQACVVTSYGELHQNAGGKTWPGFEPGSHGLAFFFPDGDWYVHYWQSYQYHWWYTAADTTDTATWYMGPYLPNQPSDPYYGFLDFCEPVDDTNGTPETWRELLEYWYDYYYGTGYTPGSF